MRALTAVGSVIGVMGILVGACVGDDPIATAPTVTPPDCAANEKRCDGTCVSSDDPRFGCASTSCLPCAGSSATNTVPTCNAGQCATTCVAGFSDCDGNAENGCEIRTATDVANCGACNVACGLAHATSRACDNGKCAFLCETGFIHCGTDASGCDVDGRADKSNCGQCARNCLEGTCANSQCSVVSLATGLTRPKGIAVEGSYLYFTNASPSNTVQRVPRSGGTVPTIYVVSDANIGAVNPQAIVAEGANLFFANLGTDVTVRRVTVPIPSGGNNVGPCDSTLAGFLAIGGGKVWWSNYTGMVRVSRANVDGSLAEDFATGTDTTTQSGAIATDGNDVYWTDVKLGKIFKRAASATSSCKVDGPPNECLAIVTGANKPYALAVDAANVYFSELDPSKKIQKVAKTGGAVTTVATEQGQVQSLATDGVHLYWGSYQDGTVRHARVDSATPCTAATCEVVANVPSPSQVIVDTEAVYWASEINGGTPNTGSLGKIGKYR